MARSFTKMDLARALEKAERISAFLRMVKFVGAGVVMNVGADDILLAIQDLAADAGDKMGDIIELLDGSEHLFSDAETA